MVNNVTCGEWRARKISSAVQACVAALLVVTASTSFADGLFVSSEEFHLRSPQQKAVIAWDGTTEQMVLASQVQADRVADLAWLVPIPSREQPRVEKGDSALFQDLAVFFGAKEPGNYWGRGMKEAGGVEVLETKKVDIYDIAVLKTSSADELMQWLNTNGFKVSPEAKSSIEMYVQKPSLYFVANKLALRNRFQAEDQKARELYLNIQQRVEIEKREVEKTIAVGMEAVKKEQAAFCPSWEATTPGPLRDRDLDQCLMDKVRERFAQMGKAVKVLPSPAMPPSVGALAIDDDIWVSFLKADGPLMRIMAFQISRGQQQLLTNFVDGRKIKGSINRQMFSYMPSEALDRVEQYGEIIQGVFMEGLAIKSRLGNKAGDLQRLAGTIDEVRLSQTTPEALFCGTAPLDYIFPGTFREKFLADISWPGPEAAQSEYCQTIEALKTGMATPLRISFEPGEPYYPLTISSSGDGRAMVDVYVVAGQAVEDRNGLLKNGRALALTPALKDTMGKVFGSGLWSQVTRFSWTGELKALTTDAVFKER